MALAGFDSLKLGAEHSINFEDGQTLVTMGIKA
jgi:hypothetical protein